METRHTYLIECYRNGSLLWDKDWKGTDSETRAHLSDLETVFNTCTFKVYRKETRHV